MSNWDRVYKMAFASVYPHYVLAVAAYTGHSPREYILDI